MNSCRPIGIVLALALGTLSACGGGGDDDDANDTGAAPATTEANGTDDPVVDEIQSLLDAALADPSIAWDGSGVDAPPTGVSVAVRLPDHDDIVLASGESVDGTPFDPEAPFNIGGVTESFVQTVAYQLVDEGLLDPTATVDQWLPNQPNAERVTVQMLLDHTHGWASFPDASLGLMAADLDRRWTLAEVLASVETNPPVAEPGTFTGEGTAVAATALAYIAEEVTGTTLAVLVEDRMAQPAGLDDTAISDGTEPPGFEDGVFAGSDGRRADTSGAPHTSYNTYFAASRSGNSTLRDLLDLLDVWQSGDLFTTNRVPGPGRFLAERSDGMDVYGSGIPFYGFCPCEDDGANLAVAAIGRAPQSPFTNNHVFHYPADGVSVVLHFNSGESPDPAPQRQLAEAIHEAAASS
ncbi:MAG TPA: serine hydrolase domain-containing protein [Acidimicrobiales bacterium]|nr:serine hydrolase domain-containing protein [Acidimicrobiales bacterium]